jgi:ABC-type antimicrobial peptide transport system permease subunit
MGTPLIAGRDFTAQDLSAGHDVCIVNEAFVSKYLREQTLGTPVMTAVSKTPLEVVGIVANTVSRSLRESVPPAIYIPHFKEGGRIGIATIEIRAEGSLAHVAELVRAELRAALPRTAVQSQVLGLTGQVENTLVQEKLLAALGSTFGVLALVLSAVGLYGLLAYTVSRATGEIGIRMALGARQATVIRMILRGALRLVAIGVLLGAPAAWAASKLVASALFGLSPGDPATIAIASILLAAVSIAAAWIPARRASRIDPMVALRME